MHYCLTNANENAELCMKIKRVFTFQVLSFVYKRYVMAQTGYRFVSAVSVRLWHCTLSLYVWGTSLLIISIIYISLWWLPAW